MNTKPPKYTISDLLEIMRALRDPETGCSWDQVQNFQTIASYTIEESYEVADAIIRADMEDLCDELGDLLLQVVYHAQMAKEANHFNFADVVCAICEKMIRRHPHVFGSQEQRNAGKQDWELIKKQERFAQGKAQQDESAIANISTGLPPLVHARKLQKKAAGIGFDWPAAEGVMNKLQEELDELKEVLQAQHPQRIEEETGDVLFSVVNLCRHTHVDAEFSLHKANMKFERRFLAMERLAVSQEKQLSELSESDLDELWEQAKQLVSQEY